MSKLSLLIAICLLPWSSRAQTAAPSAVTEWIRGSAIPLATPVAGHGFEDMQPLKRVVGNSRIVSLGEATHGSREFFQLKHRMLEFLATQMGFTIFSIEANMPEAYKLNDYVLTGKGDPAALIKGMYFWTWSTEEVLDMVKWMRTFNESGKGPVQFTGFDMQTPNVAIDIVRDAVAKSEPAFGDEIATARKLALAPVKPPRASFGTAIGTFPVAPALGKTIRFSGYIKTQDVTGYAGLWWRADSGEGQHVLENMQNYGIKGTTDWTPYAFELKVPADATNINFGVLMGGDGTSWFDDLKVEIDGKPYQSSEFDFGFEAPAMKGLYAGTPTYPGRLDREVFHGGQQSFRLSHAATPVNPNAVDPKEAAAEWKKVVEHLEAAEKRDEWVIQNARVVLQCMQMRGNEVSRDASMAANVKWILEQNPKAKIVLWAHNGHVMTGTKYSMGSELRKMYGPEMTVFGFSFNQGGFQAVSSDAKGLHDFNVPPAPNGSLDATLASARIPLLALDLRGAPKSGAVADWLKAGHDTRSIGAIYPENNPYAFMAPIVAPERFDVMLFVESPTPARKLASAQVPPAVAYKAGTPDAAGAVEYRDPEYAVSVTLPKDWTIAQAFRWGDHETTVSFSLPGQPQAGALYFKMRHNPAKSEEESRKALLTNPASKANQRVTSGLGDYAFRPGAEETRTINGRPALTSVADFTQNGEKMVEYFVWISGDEAGAQFFARAPATELEALRKRAALVIESIKIP